MLNKYPKNFSVQKISQLGEDFFIASVNFSDLFGLYKFSIRSDQNLEGFNRATDEKKINEIAKFITKSNHKESKIPLFVSPIILGFSTDDQNVKISNNNLEIKNNLEDDFKALVVDGQHRLKGIEKWFGGGLSNNDIEVSVVFLIDYSEYQLAEIFANVNFTQKPVNKSLYYDIFGASPFMPISEIRIAHLLIKKINRKMKSEFDIDFIKMLPNGTGAISQGFFGDKVLKLLNNNFVYGIKYYSLEQQFKDYDKDSISSETIEKNDDFLDINLDLINYFSAIQKVFGNQGIIYKTNGIGGLLRLLEDFHLLGISDYIREFSRVGNKNFFKNDLYLSGSESTQSRIYKDLARELFYGEELKKFNQKNIFHFDDFNIKMDRLLNSEHEKQIKKKIFRLLLDDGVINHKGNGFYEVLKS